MKRVNWVIYFFLVGLFVAMCATIPAIVGYLDWNPFLWFGSALLILIGGTVWVVMKARKEGARGRFK